MSEIARITDQLNRSYEGNAWHGPSVKEALEGVTAEAAARAPIEGAHTIWELVNHIAAWADIVRRRVGGEVFNVTDDLNFPQVREISEEQWLESLSRLAESQRKLLEFIQTIPESRLDEVIVAGGPSIYIQLHGVAQHHIYHAAQIVLLKKVLTTRS